MLLLIPRRSGPRLWSLLAVFLMVTAQAGTQAAPGDKLKLPAPKFSNAKAFDVSQPLYDLARAASLRAAPLAAASSLVEMRPERGRVPEDRGFSGDGAVQAESTALRLAGSPAPTILAPRLTFEGLSNQDNFDVFGFRVNPPDPVGDVGPNHYVEMINLVFGVYDKAGTLLVGPADIGSLWAGFAVPDCTDPSGDPIVVYDQLADRWILS